MTDKQPEALRLADELDCRGMNRPSWTDQFDAGYKLRRLHEEVQQWQEKCNTYVELHDAVVKDSDRLYALNAELVEALQAVIRGVPDTWEGVVRAKAVLRKSQGDNNG
jgi:hypothetical protein